MNHAPVVIVGAGLSGLYAAWLLERQGVRDVVMLEARDLPGGRIAGLQTGQRAEAPSLLDRFDLGPTWFWPDQQRSLHHLVDALGLQRFAQHDTGDMLVERAVGQLPVRMRGYVSAPPSMRLAGGMNALTDALYDGLRSTRLLMGQVVHAMRRVQAGVELDCADANGILTTWRAGQVLLAVPPRLAASTIRFEPALPALLARQWQATPTWMAPHAKYLAVFDAPFWREQGLSGAARSAIGPLAEIHDASMPGGSAALFGFLGLPASVRQRLTDEELRAQCRVQFGRLFGPAAAAPRIDIIKDWAQDRWTATSADLHAGGGHARAPSAAADRGPWQGCLAGIASEWSSQFPGYVAGAIDAAALGVQVLASLDGRHEILASRSRP